MARALSVAKRRTNAKRRTPAKRRTNRSPAKRRTSARRTNRSATPARRNNAAKQLANLKARANKMTAQYSIGVHAVGESLATQGGVAAGAYATGMLGSQKMKLGNHPLLDARLLIGGGLVTLGVVSSFKSKPNNKDDYALAFGNGVLGSYVYEHAYNMGIEKAAAKGSVTLSAPGAPYPTGRTAMRGEFGREVYVTPSTAGRSGLGYKG